MRRLRLFETTQQLSCGQIVLLFLILCFLAWWQISPSITFTNERQVFVGLGRTHTTALLVGRYECGFPWAWEVGKCSLAVPGPSATMDYKRERMFAPALIADLFGCFGVIWVVVVIMDQTNFAIERRQPSSIGEKAPAPSDSISTRARVGPGRLLIPWLVMPSVIAFFLWLSPGFRTDELRRSLLFWAIAFPIFCNVAQVYNERFFRPQSRSND